MLSSPFCETEIKIIVLRRPAEVNTGTRRTVSGTQAALNKCQGLPLLPHQKAGPGRAETDCPAHCQFPAPAAVPVGSRPTFGICWVNGWFSEPRPWQRMAVRAGGATHVAVVFHS